MSDHAVSAAAVSGVAVSNPSVSMTINGSRRRGSPEPRKTLADFLREDCELTGTHLGCEHGVCGACTVLLDGEAVRSCLVFAVQASDTQITTIEGLASPDGTLSVVQQAMHEAHGLQCGFCTPGFVVSITALLRDNPNPTDGQIGEGLSGNLCRCTGYQGIIKAVKIAASRLATGDLSGGGPANTGASNAGPANAGPANAGVSNAGVSNAGVEKSGSANGSASTSDQSNGQAHA